jgi:hypothetical protein
MWARVPCWNIKDQPIRKFAVACAEFKELHCVV